MPYSSNEGKKFFKEWSYYLMQEGEILSVLDIGAGAGMYGMLVRESKNSLLADSMKGDITRYKPGVLDNLNSKFSVEAVEIFKQYIDNFRLKTIYDKIYHADITDIVDQLPMYDLIIAGDVIEHLTKVSALQLIDQILDHCKFLFISIPTFYPKYSWVRGYNQKSHEWEKNINEKHLYDWSYSELQVELDPLICYALYPTVSILVKGGRIAS